MLVPPSTEDSESAPEISDHIYDINSFIFLHHPTLFGISLLAQEMFGCCSGY